MRGKSDVPVSRTGPRSLLRSSLCIRSSQIRTCETPAMPPSPSRLSQYPCLLERDTVTVRSQVEPAGRPPSPFGRIGRGRQPRHAWLPTHSLPRPD
jgi:hypothetical protein